MTYIYTASGLNSWLRERFATFEGPPRAYFGLPFSVQLMDSVLEMEHRVTYITLGLKGLEEDCCNEVARVLQELVTAEVFADAMEPLFIRHWFAYDADGQLRGRLAFWRKDLNQRLMASRIFKPEGDLFRPAQRMEPK